MKYLDNLSSRVVREGLPWEAAVSIPPGMEDKKKRDAWAASPKTSHVIYSGFEGINPDARITSSEEFDNPPAILHALVIDIDSPATDAQIEKYITWIPWPVAYVERTLTPGHWRAVCLLDEPMRVPESRGLVQKFLEFLITGEKIRKIPKFDDGAFTEPGRYYITSGNWAAINGGTARVESAKIRGELIRFLKQAKSSDLRKPREIPWSAIEAAMVEKYGAGFWPEQFKPNTQGPTFWVEDSTSPKSAILHEWGFYTYSAHAPKSIYTWPDMLGKKWVDNFAGDLIAEATREIYFDGSHYWIPREVGDGYESKRDQDISRHLRVTYGLVDSRDESGNPSMLDQALEVIQTQNRVNGAGSFIFREPGLIYRSSGERSLNIKRIMPVEPFGSPVEWGEGFPTIARFFDGFLVDDFQRKHYLYFYASKYQSIRKGLVHLSQAVQIYGAVSLGKSWHCEAIAIPLFGGASVDASSVLTGKTNHGGEVYEEPVWAVNDKVLASNASSRNVLTGVVKSIIADRTHSQHYKFKTPCQIEWPGIVIMTGNTDPASLRRMSLDLDQNIRDKVCIYRAADEPALDHFPRPQDIKHELPYFARFLNDLEIPQDLRDARWGVKAFIDETIESAMDSSSPATTFAIFLEHNREAIAACFGKGDTTTLVSVFETVQANNGSQFFKRMEFASFCSLLEQSIGKIGWLQLDGARQSVKLIR